MSEIDWDKAPEGYQLWLKDLEPSTTLDQSGWHRDEGDRYTDVHGRYWLKRDGGKYSVYERPSPAWSGDGLPPVGSVLEYMWNYKPEGSEYVQVEILVHDKGNAVMRTLDGPDPGVLRESRGGRCGTGSGQPIFRPIRTPEQIAADEREAAIEQMWKVFYDAPGLAKEGIEALYDAGFRKA